MSTLALRQLLDELSSFDVKALRRKVINVQAHSFVIEKEHFIAQFVESLAEQYRLKPPEQQELRTLVEKEWGGVVFRARIIFRAQRKNIVTDIQPDRIVAIYYGPRSNYYAIFDDFFKSKGAYYGIWASVLKNTKAFILGTNRRIATKEIDRGEQKGKVVEAFGISDLFDEGHNVGSNIEYAVASVFAPHLGNTDIMQVLATAPAAANPLDDTQNILVGVSSKFSNERPEGDDFRKTITVSLEAKGANRRKGSNEEKSVRPAVIAHVQKVLAGKTPIEWADQESSDSVMTTIEKSLINTAINAGAKGTRQRYNSKSGKAEDTKKYTETIQGSRARFKVKGPRLDAAQTAQASYLSLITLLNARLPPQVRANMGSPRLNNRTGRLSESARVVNIATTPGGFPRIEYTYQRSPYDVFDKKLGKKPWNTPDRDPSDLVGMSVRQIAADLGMRRFYTRRAD